MNNMKTIFSLVILVLMALLLNMSAYVVDQREQALVLQFGKPQTVVQEHGLHFKLPWQSVTFFDQRLLMQDAQTNEVITKDKKTLLVDDYTRWRIVDPLKVFQVAATQQGVAARMEDIVRSKMRDVLGQYTLAEIVTGVTEDGRNSNIDVITKTDLRAVMLQTIRKEADSDSKSLGIHILDVRIKLTNLPPENSKAVFQRMKAERERIAKEYRSEGEEAAREIRATADKTRKVVLAEAYKQAEIIRGKADAQATRIYAHAHSQDVKFYAFWRSLEAYRASINKGTTLVLTPDSEIFQFFGKSKHK